jgi:hypothetical protein
MHVAMARLETWREGCIVSATERETKYNVSRCMFHEDTADEVDGMT